MGAVPPCAFDASIVLVVDSPLVEGNEESAFNAGRVDRSIVMNAADYVRVANPRLADISQPLAFPFAFPFAS
ncbi:hypothetical protein H3V53_14645 [Paraburkholderia bengalensis]|uniref:Uncharacterized protein n=1 Tax=Paraburkholderia bengalensis TaxID=2747562 RepID=A0ABU8IRZ6_9BURK